MHLEILNSSKENLDYEFHGDPSDTSLLAIIGHGVTGNKDRPWAISLAEALEKAGFNALRFSFSGNGKSGGKFEDCTIAKELKDLKTVVDAAEEEGYHRVCYIGHSLGAAVGVLAAAKDERIELLVSLSGMGDTKGFVEREFGDLKPGKDCMWDNEACPLSQAFVDDLNKIDNVFGKTEKIEVPWLIVHGDADDVVPVEEGQKMYASAYEPKEIVILPGVDHVYSGDGVEKMTAEVVAWLKGHHS
ncbi:MAG: alpha/beta fold hydrolase [Verrucomicrobiales bacterium]|jgi:alpha/beta superfamily hydrolase|nr:alpha/beta fold hydrolase [Verrucomicrobiales bacterium]MBP9223217.1 alpha/beta fold hydrolase [Verrucomicrobiales bacterium]HQZ28713.1 alpha/beta fold hydrolase [Verrucomicrobiales bacterium]